MLEPSAASAARSLRSIVPLAALVLAGCGGVQSSLRPAAREAALIHELWVIMAVGAVLVWAGVMAFALYATVFRPGRHSPRVARRVIVIGGVVIPVIVLTLLLARGLALMPKLRPALDEDALRIAVSGERWWWRVHYQLPDGNVALANEIRLPVGVPVEFLLTSPDVIHSFWIPALAGKVDMTPGRETRLVVTPTQTGVFRGACAEYCGASHARMNFMVEVMARAEFERWLVRERGDAVTPSSALAVEGSRAFLRNGCGACHTVRGTAANGGIGPDLTHVGSRMSLAAGTLPNDAPSFREWIARTHAIKPEVRMPSFGMLSPRELDAIAHYLEGLQ